MHAGENSVVLLLGDWCMEAAATGAVFTARDAQGHTLSARLNGKQSAAPTPETPFRHEETPAEDRTPNVADRPEIRLLLQPPPSPKAPYSASDDWLRPRRDPGNSAHSITPLHLPPAPAWRSTGDATDARIWGDTVLVLGNSGLRGLDLNTGHEKWSDSSVISLGDMTPDGRVAVEYNSEARSTGDDSKDSSYPVALLNAATGREAWRVGQNGPQSPLSIDGDTLYLCDKDRGLVRLRLSDGSFIPTVTPLLDGWDTSWDSTAFTEGQILFERYPWLYALNKDDPRYGTKFYAGGGHPLVADDYVVATNDAYLEGYAFRREDKWLRPVWKTSRTLAGLRSLCWTPVGEHGSTLQLRRDSRTYVDSLALVEIPSGQSVWEDTNYHPEGCLAAGDQIIIQETLQLAPGEESQGVIPPRLGVRDARTGKLLWENADYSGVPLAASRGNLLIANPGELVCLR